MKEKDLLKIWQSFADEKKKEEDIIQKILNIFNENDFDPENDEIPLNWELSPVEIGILSKLKSEPRKFYKAISDFQIDTDPLGDYLIFKIEETDEVYLVSQSEVLSVSGVF